MQGFSITQAEASAAAAGVLDGEQGSVADDRSWDGPPAGAFHDPNLALNALELIPS
jgi:hypothetical protein